jgi:hypothetical protein
LGATYNNNLNESVCISHLGLEKEGQYTCCIAQASPADGENANKNMDSRFVQLRNLLCNILR